jgi:serine/threonine protein kinase
MPEGIQQSEPETVDIPLELYDIDVTLIENNPECPVHSFAWMKAHRGVQAGVLENEKGKPYAYTFTPTGPVRYQEIPGTTNPQYRHLIPMKDIKLGRTVMAKSANKSMGGSWSMWTNIVGEAHRAGLTHHPYIANIYDMATRGDGSDTLYVIMEFLPNGTLQDWLKKNHEIGEIASVVDKISQALDHINNERQFLYADMKPLNVVFDEKWNPKIVDFELADKIGKDGTALSQHATREYEAPEQRNETFITVRTDVYRLAATVFTILVDDQDLSEIGYTRQAFERDESAPIPFRNHYSSQLSVKQQRKISEIFHKALHHDPLERYASVAELNKELQKVFASK